MPTQTPGFTRRPPNRAFVYVAAAFAALGGLLFGYDTGVISGAELFLKNDFTLSTFALEVIVSGVLAGAAAGALLGGRLADLFGRRRLLIATAIIFGLGGLGCAAATSPAMLIIGRIIVGLGIGLASGTVPVYISEVSPADARGWQVSLFQLAITVGILLAYVVDYAFASIQGWRWMFGLAVLPAAIFGLGMVFLPESPRWLAETAITIAPAPCSSAFAAPPTWIAEMLEIDKASSAPRRARPLSDLFAPSLRPALDRGHRARGLPASYGHQHRNLLRSADHSILRHLLGLRSNSGHCRHRRRERADDHRRHVADRPHGAPPAVADRYCRHDRHAGHSRAWLSTWPAGRAHSHGSPWSA